MIRRQNSDDETAKLAADWSEYLRHHGELQVPFDTDAERDLYRRVGRKAGRLLGRPARTVFVVLDDWMDNPLQVQVENNRGRKAMNKAFSDDNQAIAPAPAPRPTLKVVPPHGEPSNG